VLGIPLIVLSRLRSTTAITKINNSQHERYHLYCDFSRRAVAKRASKNIAHFSELETTQESRWYDGSMETQTHKVLLSDHK